MSRGFCRSGIVSLNKLKASESIFDIGYLENSVEKKNEDEFVFRVIA